MAQAMGYGLTLLRSQEPEAIRLAFWVRSRDRVRNKNGIQTRECEARRFTLPDSESRGWMIRTAPRAPKGPLRIAQRFIAGWKKGRGAWGVP